MSDRRKTGHEEESPVPRILVYAAVWLGYQAGWPRTAESVARAAALDENVPTQTT